MFPCDIKIEGHIYKLLEHFHSARMANHNDRPDLILEILAARDGYIAKRVTRKSKSKTHVMKRK